MIKKHKEIFLAIVIITLIVSNIYLIYKYNTIEKEEIITQEILFTKVDGKYNQKKKYYATINYKKFKKLLKSNKVSTIAILDNSSNTYVKFIEMINKISFYKSTKIYLLETSKLSSKNEISFFEIDERLKDLETNYIITINKGKIISITTFDNEQINTIIEGIGE